jgi:uncharacterized protein YndB with AHSA1/START domain
MPAKKSAAAKASGAGKRELVITRVFDAPRELVWKAFADPKAAGQWWGPRNFTTPILELDVRPGGKWRAVMRSPEGKEYPQHGVYREIVPPERLVFTLIWDDEGPGSEMLCTFTFAEQGKRTKMVFRKGPFTSAEHEKGEKQGWGEAFDRFAEFLEKGGRGAPKARM